MRRRSIRSLLRGKDKFNEDIKEPIYAHSEIEIKQSVERDRKLTLAMAVHPRSTLVAEKQKK